MKIKSFDQAKLILIKSMIPFLIAYPIVLGIIIYYVYDLLNIPTEVRYLMLIGGIFTYIILLFLMPLKTIITFDRMDDQITFITKKITGTTSLQVPIVDIQSAHLESNQSSGKYPRISNQGIGIKSSKQITHRIILIDKNDQIIPLTKSFSSDLKSKEKALKAIKDFLQIQ